MRFLRGCEIAAAHFNSSQTLDLDAAALVLLACPPPTCEVYFYLVHSIPWWAWLRRYVIACDCEDEWKEG